MSDGPDGAVGAGHDWVRPTLIAGAIDTVGIIPVFLTGAMAVQLEADIGLQVDSLGFVYASYFAAAAALSIPVGRLSERTGPSLSLRIGTLLTSGALLGVAVLVTSPLLLTLFIVLAGFGTSLTRTASSVLVARAVSFDRQGRAFGLKNSAIPMAALLSGLAVPVIALSVGWRWSFVLASLLAFSVLFVIPHDVPPPPGRPAKIKADLGTGTLILAALGGGFGAASVSSLGAFSVVTAVDAGIAEANAGLLVAVASVLGLVTRVSVGFWADRRPGSQMDLASALLTLGACGLALISVSGAGLLWFAIPLAYATGWAFFGTFYLAIVRLNPSAPGHAVGVTQAAAFGGSIVGPITLGLLAKNVSFSAAWVAAAVSGAIAGGITFVIWRLILKEPIRRRSGVSG